MTKKTFFVNGHVVDILTQKGMKLNSRQHRQLATLIVNRKFLSYINKI